MRYAYIALSTICAVSFASEGLAESPGNPRCYVSKDRRSDRLANLELEQLDTIDGFVASRVQSNLSWLRSGSKLLAWQLYQPQQLWEVDAPAGADMALGLCNPRNVSRGECLFIADIDAGTAAEERAIYKVPEPMLGSANTQPLAAERYPIAYDLAEGEEAPAAASLGVHPLTGTFYIVTREANEARVFEGAAPNLPGDTITFRVVGKVGLDQPTGADMSPDGNFFIVRNATDAVEYSVVNADMAATLMEPGERLPLEDDDGGQSIAYAPLREPVGLDRGFGPVDFILRHHKIQPFNLYTAGASASQPVFYYGYLCDAPPRPEPRPEPYDMRPPNPRDMGISEDMGVSEDMGDAPGDDEDGGCSSAGAGAPAALLWLLAPLAARVRRRKGGDV